MNRIRGYKAIFAAVCMLSMLSLAAPEVSNLNALQRYPWNGLVDIEFTVSGIEEGMIYFPVAVATNLDTMTAVPVKSLKLWHGGTNTSAAVFTSNGTYRVIWDAPADVGEVVISNLCLNVCDPFNVHKAVQLWENGPYWAECNIGAENPWDAGYYFWWGDTVGYKRENNKWVASDGSNGNFSFGSGSTPTDGKNNSTLQSEGWITGDGVLAAAHDAAHVHWGNGWRMPTDADMQALISNTTTEWITTNGINGRLVHGKGSFANRSIFLPASGLGNGTYLYESGSSGDYWSSTPISGYAWYLSFGSGDFRRSYARGSGHSVRPLLEFAE